MRIEIRGARLVDPAANTEANASLFMAEGKIAATAGRPTASSPTR
jgi:predicted amidohydrolase